MRIKLHPISASFSLNIWGPQPGLPAAGLKIKKEKQWQIMYRRSSAPARQSPAPK
jgi:hypothetical protein